MVPNLTIILDLPIADGLSRATGRDGARQGDGEDRFERKGAAFHEAVRAAFLDIAARAPARCRVIDASRPPHAVAADVASETAPLIERWKARHG